MERLELSEENRREISRRCNHFDYEGLVELSVMAETAAGTLNDADTATGLHKTAGVDASTIQSETVVLTWDSLAGAWYVTEINRSQTSVEDGLAGDYSAL